MKSEFLIGFFLFAGILFSSPVQAQGFCRPQRRPIAVISSGGTSLGAYQAGALFRLLQSLQTESDRYELKLLAGASAGGVNSLLAFQDYCADTSPNWLYHFWTQPVGKDLFFPAKSSHDQNSLLNAGAFDSIQNKFFQSWGRSRHHCDLVLSIPLTLRDPLKLNYSAQQESNAQFLNFALRVEPGTPARLSNYVNLGENAANFMLQIPSQSSEQILQKVARATTSIPYVFSPQTVPFCALSVNDPQAARLQTPLNCPNESVRQGEFIDGALLDATPLAQAVRLLKRGLARQCPTGQNFWRPLPTAKAGDSLDPYTLLINLDVRNRKPLAGAPRETFSSGVFGLLGDLLSSTRDRELTQIIESDVGIRSQILSLRSHFPRWSEDWNGFFGFFDRDFRAFDFWVGYVDMEESLRKDFPDLLGKPEKWAKMPTSPLADCLRQSLRSPASFNIRQACPQLQPHEAHLFAILQRENQQGSVAEGGPSPFYRRLDQLTQARFEFDELELSPDQTAQAPTLVRDWLGRSTRQFSEKFPHDSGTTLDAISSYLFGLTDPIPEKQYFYMAWGNSFEIGWSSLIGVDYFQNRFWRWPLALEVYAPRALSTSLENTSSFSLLTGIELQKPWSSGIDYLFSLRGGYQWTAGTLSPPQCAAGNLEYCQGPTLSPMIAAVFFQTLRLQTGVKFTWDPVNGGKPAVAGLFLGGLNF